LPFGLLREKGSLNLLALVCEGKKIKVNPCCNLAAIAFPVEVGTPSATEEDYGLEKEFHISPNTADKVGGLGSIL